MLPRLFQTALLGGLLFLANIGLAMAEETGTRAAALVGYWEYTVGTTTFTVGFVPDGRYLLVTKAEGQPQYESGTYRILEEKLVLKPQSQPEVSFAFNLADDKLTVSGGPFPDGVTFTKKPGSETAILEDLRRVDAAKAKEDADWRQRIKVAPMGNNPPHHTIAVGDIPVDPNPTHIFPKPTVFAAPEVYYQLGLPKTVVFTDGTRRSVHDSWRWHFYPDGRVFLRSVIFRDNDPINGKTVTAWGRYTVQPGGKEEPGGRVELMTIESDKGEKLSLRLIDGRRNLDWKGDIYINTKTDKDVNP